MIDKRTQESHRKKEAVLSAAKSCFGEYGFKSTTMDTIAKKAGVSKGTVFTFYASKIALFEAVVSFTLDNMTTKISAKLETLSHADDLLTATFLSGYVECQNDITTVNTFRTETRHDISHVFNHYGEIWLNLFKAAIQRGKDTGIYRHDIAIDTVALIIYETHKALINKMFEGSDQNAITLSTMQSAIALFIDGLKQQGR